MDFQADTGGGVEFVRHAAVGRLVRSQEAGRTGILVAVMSVRGKYPRRGRVLWAYVRPVGGGIEWTTLLEDVMAVEECPPEEST